MDKSLVLIGGISSQTNHAIISVFEFGSGMELCSELSLKPLKVQKLLALKLSQTNREIGIATTNKMILMMGIDYSQKMIDVLKVIDIQMSSLYSSICLYGDSCYIATGDYQGDNSILEVKFNTQI